ncbi:MAG: hypothetical protein ABL957_11945 [Parvularculaceae bacterium]
MKLRKSKGHEGRIVERATGDGVADETPVDASRDRQPKGPKPGGAAVYSSSLPPSAFSGGSLFEEE